MASISRLINICVKDLEKRNMVKPVAEMAYQKEEAVDERLRSKVRLAGHEMHVDNASETNHAFNITWVLFVNFLSEIRHEEIVYL